MRDYSLAPRKGIETMVLLDLLELERLRGSTKLVAQTADAARAQQTDQAAAFVAFRFDTLETDCGTGAAALMVVVFAKYLDTALTLQ